MKEDFAFEDFLKEKVSDYRIKPSEGAWEFIQASVRSVYRPQFHYPLILLWTVIFLNIGLPICEMNIHKIPNIISAQTVHSESIITVNPTPPLFRVKKAVVKLADDSSETSVVHPKESSSIVKPMLETIAVQRGTEYLIINNKPPVFIQRNMFAPVDLTASAPENKDYKLIDKLKDKFKKISYNKSLNFYFTPSLSYRILYIDNRPYFRNNGAGIESSVSHFPATGLETGISLIKPISKRWRFRSGVQLNFSRYSINASKTNAELVYVTLSQDNGFERNTNIRNGGGLLPKKLMNENLQISLPFGLEFMAAGNDKLSLNLAGTVQPSISLYAGGYMVTTNYKSYIPAENLFRKYNIQTGVEIFLKTNMGMIDLQAGPQLRYQVLSNTIGSYPVKEHLIDYGFKIGIVKKIQ